jgi:hypothetical protein
MRHPALVRDRVLAGAVEYLERLRIRVSMLPETETDVLRVVERPQQHDLAVDITNFVMEKFGHTTAPKEPRFDKTRRAAAKKNPRRGRGVLKPEDKALLEGNTGESTDG